MPRIDDIHPSEDLDTAAMEYVRAFAQADPAARPRLREDFVSRALPFAHRLARRYRGRGEPPEDLEQVARLGLVKTVDRYDPERGSFTAYAVATITGEIKRHFRNHTWGLHVPRRLQDLCLEIGQADALLTARLARAPGDTEVAEHLGIDLADVRAARDSATAHHPASLNARVGRDGATEVVDLLGGLDRQLSMVDDRTAVEGLLWHLPARERRMLALRFYGNLTQAEIAEKLGISQMHVSRLLSRALSRLRQAILSDTVQPWTGADDADHRLKVNVIYRGGVVRACVAGEIDRDNAGYLREELLSVVRTCDRVRRLVVDLTGVPLLDAAGVAVLLAVHEAARVRGIRLRAAGLQPYVAHVVAVSGLRDLIQD